MIPQQVMRLADSPSYRRTLAARLDAERERKNNGTIPGGLASMVDAGVAGYLRHKDATDQDKAMAALSGGMSESSQIGTRDGQQPNAPQIEPGMQSAEARLAALKGNPYAGRLSAQLAFERAEQEKQARQLQDQRAYQQGIMEQQRGWRQEDMTAQQAFQQDMLARQQAFARSQQRPAAPPAAIQQYEYARANGFDGSFVDFQLALKKAGASNVSVNTGDAPSREMPGLPKLPSGYDFRRGADGQPLIGDDGNISIVPIPGGPAALDEKSLAQKAQSKGEGEARKASLVLEDIGRFRSKIENAPWYSPVTGLGGSVLRSIPGSGAFNAKAVSDSIRANIGFDRLQQMRDESPTGGALGAVNNQEMQLLQSVLGSIDQAQSEDQLLHNLERLDGIYRGVLKKLSAYPNAGQYGIPGAGETGNGITAVPGGNNDPLGIR